MPTHPNIHIRSATLQDKDFIISLLPRLTEFGPPPWRDVSQMMELDTHILTNKLSNPPVGTAIFIAEDDQNKALGFIHLQTGSDYYYSQTHGHISDLIIAPEGEGRGIARALIEAAEQWAVAQGFSWLTLSVFAQNTHAREVYKRLGYGEDIMKYVKAIK